MEYTKVLVTGGAGFVGSSLALMLKRTYPNATVYALDNLMRKGSELNVPRLEAAGVTFVQGDIRTAQTFLQFGGVELILDCAAEPSVLAGKDGSPMYVLETNLWGTVNVLELARKESARVLFFSSSRIYPVAELNDIVVSESDTRFVIEPTQTLPGITEQGISESFPLGIQRTLYGATKLSSEMLIHEYASLYGVKAIINRCGVIAGPWQFGKVDQGVAVLWMANHVFNKPLAYIGFGGTGKQVRDFLHIDDLCDAVAAELAQFDTLLGSTFNIGGGVFSSASLKELTVLCQQISAVTVPVGSEPQTRWGDVKLYVSDSRAFEQATGWKPKRTIETLFSDIHRWIVEHRSVLEPLLG